MFLLEENSRQEECVFVLGQLYNMCRCKYSYETCVDASTGNIFDAKFVDARGCTLSDDVAQFLTGLYAIIAINFQDL